MPSIKLYKQTGEQAGEVALDESVFGVEYKEALIHQVLVAQRNNARQGTKSALTRTEVRGGGIKPWRQKGTGRARQGSTRAPQWIKGGVVFAPKPRDFSQKINKQSKRLAIVSALSQKTAQSELIVVDKIVLSDAKTKEMVAVLKALNTAGRVLLVVTEADAAVVRAANNLQNVTILPSSQINVYDLVASGKCVATLEAIKKIEEAYKA